MIEFVNFIKPHNSPISYLKFLSEEPHKADFPPEHMKKLQDYKNRLQVIAKLSGISIEDINMINLSYEAACTSIVISKKNEDGTREIFMGRNLDFNFKHYLFNLSYEAHYFKRNQLIFKVQNMAGYAGILNGIKIGKFGVSFNQRFYDVNSQENIARWMKGYLSPAYVMFDLMLNSNNFNESLSLLSHSQITTSAYYILSGINKNEGVIITRKFDRVVDVDRLDEDSGKWFLVQTNDDRYAISDTRRVAAEKRISDLKNINYENLMKDVLSLSPTNNPSTIYTTVQSHSKNIFNSNYYDSK